MYSCFQLQYGIGTIYIVWGEGAVNVEKFYDNTARRAPDFINVRQKVKSTSEIQRHNISNR